MIATMIYRAFPAVLVALAAAWPGIPAAAAQPVRVELTDLATGQPFRAPPGAASPRS